MKNSKETIGIMQFGCAKNLVDTELMLGVLAKNGYSYSLDPYDKNIKKVVISTCSFIQDAERESVSAIMDMINQGKEIILTGCLVQKYKDELKKLLPEVKHFLGVCEYDKILEALKNDNYSNISDEINYCYREDVKREQITVGSSSYLKIAEGCFYKCGYCIIPKLRGEYRSRKMENIIDEARELVKKGVNEIILIAQDTTSYGLDLYKKPMLYKLLEELNKIEGLGWIRVMYSYPTNFDDKLINAIKTLDKVVKYVDMPLQHSHPDVLKRMLRPAQDYTKLIEKIRKEIPNVTIRTTFIVGYPGETEEEFQHLYDFIQNVKFDRVGVFCYSREKDTYAYSLKPQVRANIKKHRKTILMKLQKNISQNINKQFTGKKICCIIESIRSDGEIVARSYRDAPDIDGLVYIKSNEYLTPGDIVEATVTKSDEYDLYAVL